MRWATPTGRGRAVAAMGLALATLGPVFGAAGLQQLGLGLVALPLLAIAVVASARHRVRVNRTISSERASAHDRLKLSIDVKNEGRAAAPLLVLEHDLPAGIRGDTPWLVKGIRPGESVNTSTSLTPTQRGRYDVPPLRISYLDPFTLARRSERKGPSHILIVHPKIHHLQLPREGRESAPIAAPALKQLTATRGEDFFTLRDYVEGDDLRKVHWSSTAKRGKLMIKQEEIPWRERATVALDDGAQSHSSAGGSASFEQAVETAASLLHLFEASGYSYRLAGAIAPGIPTGHGPDHYRRCLDLLAEIAPERRRARHEPLIVRLAELSSRSPAEEALVLLTGELSPAVAAGATQCRRSFKRLAVMSFTPAKPKRTFAPRAPQGATRERSAALLTAAGIRSVIVGPEDSPVAAWETLWRHPHRKGGRSWDAMRVFA